MNKPKVVCLCGSSRFKEAFEIANMHETLRGNIVISMGMFGHSDLPSGSKFLTGDGDSSNKTKAMLDELHFKKIDLAEEVVVVNVGGYIGQSTRNEIAYATNHGTPVRMLFSD